MCTGRIDLGHVLRAFAKGADGVFVAGCHLNECNYTTHGNFHALGMVQLGRRLIEQVGLDPERLRMELVSSGEGNRFAELMNGFGRTVRKLGPVGRAEGVEPGDLEARLQRLTALVPYLKLATGEKVRARLSSEEAYGELFGRGEVEELLRQVVSYTIDPEVCQACMTCARRCPVDAVDGGKGLVHVIDQNKCIRCGTCFEACPPRFGAVQKLVGQPVPPPPPEERRAVVRRSKEQAA